MKKKPELAAGSYFPWAVIDDSSQMRRGVVGDDLGVLEDGDRIVEDEIECAIDLAHAFTGKGDQTIVFSISEDDQWRRPDSLTSSMEKNTSLVVFSIGEDNQRKRPI
nr:hypothetical protein Iba_chr03bCG6970 [Ipomoea batatas]